MLKIGIEQEFVFVDRDGRYLDAEVTDYSLFSGIVEDFPAIDGDDEYLECKSLEKYPKRVYVEGFELHDRNGKKLETIPKALEIRTLPHASVRAVLEDFQSSYAQVMRLAGRAGLSPVLTSRHPFKTAISLDHRLGTVEDKVRSAAEFALARRAMLSHGLHVNVSLGDASSERMQDLVQKIRYYSPALIPWSFSSPFFKGKAFEGLSTRNYFRAGTRSVVGVQKRHGVYLAEFRAFDTCGDARLLRALLYLFSGFLLDESLPGRLAEQDPERLKLSAIQGFADPSLRKEGQLILIAAASALGGANEELKLLETMLVENDSYAARMKRSFAKSSCIIDCISGLYDYGYRGE